MVRAYIAGGARGNPGPAGYGVRIEAADGSLIEELHGGLGITTNNVAEYNGLLAALKWAVDHGDRLSQMQARLTGATTSGTISLEHYQFASVSAHVLVPFGAQVGTSLGLDSIGTVVTETYDASGAVVTRTSAPFSLTFAVRQALGDRWLTVAVLPVAATT